MEDRTCTGCGATFTPTHGRQRCCSPKCRKPSHRMIAKKCDACGSTCMKYAGKQRYANTFCSQECRDASMRKPKVEPLPIELRYRHLRSELRAAVEDGRTEDIIPAVRERCEITESGCWEWQGRVKDGYPEITMGPKWVAVHRLVLETKLGAPLGAQPAHHMCANTVCVNADHLQPVTHAENAAEMMARNYMVARIRQLEEALAEVAPNHHALTDLSIPA